MSLHGCSAGRGQRDIPVHIFPARMTGPDWETFRTGQSTTLREFWSQLQAIFDASERTRRVPRITVNTHGRYESR